MNSTDTEKTRKRYFLGNVTYLLLVLFILSALFVLSAFLGFKPAKKLIQSNYPTKVVRHTHCLTGYYPDFRNSCFDVEEVKVYRMLYITPLCKWFRGFETPETIRGISPGNIYGTSWEGKRYCGVKPPVAVAIFEIPFDKYDKE